MNDESEDILRDNGFYKCSICGEWKKETDPLYCSEYCEELATDW
jgi:hypothetical protein